MRKLSVLILEDDKRLLEELSEYLGSRELRIIRADRPSAAFVALDGAPCDIALIDLKLPEYDGIEFLKRVKRQLPELEAIIMSGHGDMESAITAFRSGASDFLRKPFSPFEIQLTISRTRKYLELQQENRWLKEAFRSLCEEAGGEGDVSLVGGSPAMRRVTGEILRAAEYPDSPVLITGESGTGKELAARLVHLRSSRKNAPFQAVNCAAVPRELFESEFFGHEKGAFTDAVSRRLGHFRTADRGTLFLDEIGELPPELQIKLLRAIEEKSVRAVGTDRSVPVDTRIVCATNRNLRELLELNRFRRDLFYRLSVLEIPMPPLRERPEDIPELAEHFLRQFCMKMGRRPMRIDSGSYRLLERYPFPGNVRELRNMVERGVIAGEEPILLAPGCVCAAGPPDPAGAENGAACVTGAGWSAGADGLNLDELERRAVRLALERTSGNKARAAGLLGISRQALDRRLEKHRP